MVRWAWTIDRSFSPFGIYGKQHKPRTRQIQPTQRGRDERHCQQGNAAPLHRRIYRLEGRRHVHLSALQRTLVSFGGQVRNRSLVIPMLMVDARRSSVQIATDTWATSFLEKERPPRIHGTVSIRCRYDLSKKAKPSPTFSGPSNK